jgi:flagellar hook-associated protein 1 FlgK
VVAGCARGGPGGARDAAGAGLFVDDGTGVGAAGRIALNAAVDPTQGGAAWRLRDGLAAASPGDEGNGAILQSLADAMSTARAATGWVTQNASADAGTMASELASFYAARAAGGEESRAYLAGRQTTLAESEMNVIGVDTDAELQSLTLVQQAYAANARVLSVIDDLMKRLLEV